MRIGVDLRVLAAGKRTGVEEYTLGLLEAMLPLGKNHEWVLFHNAWRKVPLTFPWRSLPWVRVVEKSLPNRPLMLSATYLNAPKLNRFLGELDVFFSPHFYPAAALRQTRLVTTFHDLAFVWHPEFSSAKKYWWHRLSAPRRQAERSRQIITISHSSKADLVNLYGIEPERVTVIYSGVSPEFTALPTDDPRREIVRKKYKLPTEFILFLGTIEPRKNLVGLMAAFERLVAAGYAGALVIAGSLGWSWQAIGAAWESSPVKDRIRFIGFVAPEDKPALYNLAALFAYPSFFEGFGFPPIEAMACGIPVLTSAVSSLPEVAGEGALLVDPRRVDEMYWGMKLLLRDEALREWLRVRGQERARQFTWQKAALSTLQVLEGVV